MLPDTVRSAMAEVVKSVRGAPPDGSYRQRAAPAPKPSVRRVMVMSWPYAWLREQRWVTPCP
jgi:hypothetical protein